MRVWLVVLGLTLIAASAVLVRVGAVEGVRTAEVVLDDATGPRLRARLFLPAGEGPFPGVLLCHGASNSKEQLDVLGLALAERGLVGLAVDFGGNGESAPRAMSDTANLADARRALAYLRRRPEVDASRLAGLGISMGSTPIAEAAREEAGVRGVVALGRAVTPSEDFRPRLLLGIGLYDQLVSPSRVEAALRHSEGGPAREAVVSPYCDHPLEGWDPQLLTTSVNWLAEVVGQTPDTASAPRAWLLPPARAAAMLGSTLLLLTVLHWLLGRLSADRLNSPTFRRGVALAGTVACLVPVLLSGVGVGPGMLLSDVGTTAVLVTLAVNWFLCRHGEPWLAGPHCPSWEQTPGAAVDPLLGIAATVAAALLASAVLYRAPYLWQHPEALLALPQYAAESLVFTPDLHLHKLRLLLFREYSTAVTPSPAWYAVLLLEVALPGAALTVAASTAERLWRRLQRRRGDPREARRPRSLKVALVRAGLAAVALAAAGMTALSTHDIDPRPIRGMAQEYVGHAVVFVTVLLVLIRLTQLPRWRPETA